MRNTLLLSATAALVFSANAAWAAPFPSPVLKSAHLNPGIFAGRDGAKTLYDQTSTVDSGETLISQNFESTYDVYDSQGADDFTVPVKTTWTVTEFDAFSYSQSTPSSENVTFYYDKNGVPGKPVKKGTFTNIVGQISGASNTIPLGKGVKLRPGHYWVSLVGNCNLQKDPACGVWGWSTSSVLHGTSAQWQNPNNGWNSSCQSWGSLETCFPTTNDPDFAFALKGKAKK